MANILLVEPDKLLAVTYMQALKSAGHGVTHCPTAQSAVLAADQTKPELVLLELQLVEHSGIEFLYEFRSYTDWQNIPVIIHSHVPIGEFADNLDLLKNELNICAYVYKPQTSLKELVEMVGDQLAIKT